MTYFWVGILVVIAAFSAVICVQAFWLWRDARRERLAWQRYRQKKAELMAKALDEGVSLKGFYE